MKKTYKNKEITSENVETKAKATPKKVYMFPKTPLGPVKVTATSRVEAEKELAKITKEK